LVILLWDAPSFVLLIALYWHLSCHWNSP
jgi:hypothetical protein